jgi:LPS export ABC transporter protein LptC
MAFPAVFFVRIEASQCHSNSSRGRERVILPTKRTLIKILVIGIVLMFGLLITVFVKYREFSDNPAKLADAIPEGTDIAIGQIRHTSVRDGRKEWSLEAASANYSGDTKEALFNEVQVIFFLENDREVMVKGQKGRLKTDTNDITVSGDVTVEDADYKLTAQQIQYDHVDRKVDIPVPVTITGQGIELHADQMTVDLASETALLEGAVKGVFRGYNTPLF